jgi:prolyl-tRNA synthetase
VFFDVEGKLVTVLVPGHLEVSEIKLRNILKTKELIPADETLIKSCGMEPGFASPIGAKNTRVLIDLALENANDLVVGANEKGFHFMHVILSATSPTMKY